MKLKPVVVTDRAAMQGIQIEVKVTLKRTLRWKLGFWLLRVATWAAALLMNCGIQVKSDE